MSRPDVSRPHVNRPHGGLRATAGRRRGLSVLHGSALTLLFALQSSPVRAQIQHDDSLYLVADPSVQSTVSTQLQKPRYRFCNDMQYRFWKLDKERICPDREVMSATCPAIAEACLRPSWEQDVEEQQVEESEGSTWLGDLLQAIAETGAVLMRILFWVLVAGGVLLIIRAIIKQVRVLRQDEQAGPAVQVPVGPSEQKQPDLVETRASILLAQAQEALRRGELRKALHLAYYATVRSMADQGWVKPHRSKTSGDYLRAVRGRAQAREASELLRSLDRARYRSTPDAGTAGELTAQVRDLVQRLSQVACVLMAFLCASCDPPTIPEPLRAPTSASGRLLFETLIEERATSLKERYEPVTSIADRTTAIIAVDAEMKPVEWDTVKAWIEDGGHLLVANPGGNFDEAFSLSTQSSLCTAQASIPDIDLHTFGNVHSASAGGVQGTALGSCGSKPLAYRFAYGLGHVTVLESSQLIDNLHLAAAHNATYALFLAGNVSGHVELLGPWTGRGSMTPWQSITRAGFSPWVLHLLLLLALYAWAWGRRFGAPVDPPGRPRRSLLEHARALSYHYRRADASGTALHHYAEWAWDQMRQRAPGSRGDAKTLARSVTSSEREAAELRQALTVARRASQLGDSKKQHIRAFNILKDTIDRLQGRQRPLAGRPSNK